MEIILLIRAMKESYEKEVALEPSRISASKTERTIFLAEEEIKDGYKIERVQHTQWQYICGVTVSNTCRKLLGFIARSSECQLKHLEVIQ